MARGNDDCPVVEVKRRGLPIVRFGAIIACGCLIATLSVTGCRGKPEPGLPSAGAPASSATELDSLKTRGQEQFEAGEYNDAFVAFKQAYDMAPDDYGVLLGLAQTNAKLRNEVEALDWVNLALAQRPEAVEPMELKGRLFLRLGRMRDATAMLERTTQKHPEYTLGWLNLAAAYSIQKNWPKAVEAAKKAIESAPDDGTPHFALGDIYIEQNERKLAEEQYRAALRIDSQHALAYMRLAQLYIGKNDVTKAELEQARNWATTSDNLEPGDGNAASAAAWALFKMGEKLEAAKEMNKVALDHPQNYRIWYRLGKILDDMGEKESAARAFETAAKFAPRIRTTTQPGNTMEEE